MGDDYMPQVLYIEPYELYFEGPYNHIVTVTINLWNPSNDPICFKVKTTAPKQYCVRPNNGVVHPQSSEDVQVMLQPGDHSNSEKHFFMVESMFLSQDFSIDQLSEIMKAASKNKLMRSKLKCRFDDGKLRIKKGEVTEPEIVEEDMQGADIKLKFRQKLESEVKELQCSVEKLASENKSLVDELKQKKKTAEEERLEKERQLAEERKAMTELNNKVESERKKLQLSVEKLSSEKKSLVEKLEQKEKTAKEEHHKRLEKERQLARIEEERKAVTELNHKVESDRKKLQLSLEELSTKKKHLEDKLMQKEKSARLAKELEVAKIEEKLKTEEEASQNLQSEKRKLELSLEEIRQTMTRTERTLQSQLEEERLRVSQLYNDKESLEKQIKDLAVKLSAGDLHDVLIAVADLQPQWEELGLSLGISQEDLKKIAGDHCSVCRYLYEVLRHWIMRIGGSWEKLVGALRSSQVDRKDVAQQIEVKYVTGIHSPKKFILINESEKCLDIDADNLVELFKSVDWRVLGLLLGLTDDTLEKIQTENSSLEQRRESMIKHWISSGQSYWSTLVEALEGPVLGETQLASALAQKHIGARNNESNITLADELVVDDRDIEKIHKEIFHVLNSTKQESNSQPRGIIYIFGISGAAGTDVDVDNIYSTFKTELKFAAFRRENLTSSHLATHIKAAATYDYPMFCKYKAFYFAGHGGIDESQQPYFNAVSENNEVISVQKNILTFFQGTHYKPSDSFMFFFDCCLSSAQTTTHDKKPFAFETPVRCLVAFATSPGRASIGNSKEGGRWTKLFCKNIKELQKAETLTSVLDRTHKAVMDCSERSQPPQYSSCVGPIYLRGPPVSETEKSQKSFVHCRKEIISSLSSDDDCLVSLASVFSHSDNIIDRNVRDRIRQTKGEAGATLLVNNLEQAIRSRPEILPKILSIMELEHVLQAVVVKMRGSKEDKGNHDITNLQKALDQAQKKAKQLEFDNEEMQAKMKQLEEEKRRQENLKKQRNDAIGKIQVLFSQIQEQQ